MTFQTLTVPLFDKTDLTTVMGSALTIARAHESMIEAISLRQRPLMPAGMFHPYSAPAIDAQFAALEDAENHMIADLEGAFTAFCDNVGITPSTGMDGAKPGAKFEVLSGLMPERIASAARLGDLSIVQTPAPKGSDWRRAIAEALIFQSGTPVLLVPGEMQAMPQSVLVAWDGSREAAVAVNAALPFLKQASDVTLLSIGNVIDGTSDATDYAHRLRRHNVHVTVKDVKIAKGKRDYDQFLDYVANDQPGLIVMGGYSHNRWRELVLGGFTRAVSERSPCPVLLAH